MTKANPKLAQQLADANKKQAKKKLFDPDATKASGFKTKRVHPKQARNNRNNAANNQPDKTNQPAPNITASGKPVRSASQPIQYTVGDDVLYNGIPWKVANVQETKKGTLSITLFHEVAGQKTIRVNPYRDHSNKLVKVQLDDKQ